VEPESVAPPQIPDWRPLWCCSGWIATRQLIWRSAAGLVAQDRESHQRDLYEAVGRGDFPK
jgi:hypothetical protein